VESKCTAATIQFGELCGRSIFNTIEKLKIGGESPLLFRLPFKNAKLSGFAGYKNDQFAVFLNSNRTLGYEVFTAAHEIYHLLEQYSKIKEDTVLQENGDDDSNQEIPEVNADLFAAELLMPEDDISKEFANQLALNSHRVPDESLIVNLQQQYYVEYKAITNRLAELELIGDKVAFKLNEILGKEESLPTLTKKLGYTNELNEPTKIFSLPKRLLKAVDDNYNEGSTSMDDLRVIFSYCDQTPQYFGYKEDELSDQARALMKKIQTELGSESNGKE